jgi:energy-coupling factor transport system permease protein
MRFDSYHPAINFIFFSAMLAMTVLFNHPVFLAISYFASFVYSVKLNGKRSFIFNFALMPLIAIWMAWYSYYTHFGVTILAINFAGNSITLESFIYGGVIGIMTASVLMWFSCIHTIISTDKIAYLFGKISPKFSLYFSILLRMIPKTKQYARKVSQAQYGIGMGIRQGNPLKRISNCFRIVSVMITWLIESLSASSESMRSRGYTLKGRTAYSIYRFDNRDRSFVTVIFWLIAVVLMGVLLDQTSILYNPEIVLNRITPLSALFYAAYLVLCLLPMALQIVTEKRYEKLRRRVFEV